jgi:hypothetical protein
MTPDELRSLIREGLPDGIMQLLGILADDKASHKNKIEAFRTLADRGVIPEIKSTVTQNVTAKLTFEDIQEERDSLLSEQAQIAEELKAIKAGGVEDAKCRQANVLPQPIEQEGTTG